MDSGETGRAGEPVKQAHAEQQDARSKRAQHEILEARFRRTVVHPQERGHDVGREAIEFEADIQRQQVSRRDHHAHAERGEHDEQREFGAHRLEAVEERRRNDQRYASARIDQQLGERCEGVGAVLAAKCLGLRPHRPAPQSGRDDEGASRQRGNSGNRDGARRLVTAPRGDEQQHKSDHRKQRLGGDKAERTGEIHQCAPPWAVCSSAAGLAPPAFTSASPLGLAWARRASSVAMSLRIGARKLSG